MEKQEIPVDQLVELVNQEIPKHPLYEGEEDRGFELKGIAPDGSLSFFHPRVRSYQFEEDSGSFKSLKKILEDCIAKVKNRPYPSAE
jgi:hypothetical protein